MWWALYWYKINVPSLILQCSRMTQAMLNMMNFKVLLREDQIKKEIEDTCTLECQICKWEEIIDIQSIRNTTPFTCSSCDAKGGLMDKRTFSLDSSITTTQTQAAYYIYYSYPETIVSTQISRTYNCMINWIKLIRSY